MPYVKIQPSWIVSGKLNMHNQSNSSMSKPDAIHRETRITSFSSTTGEEISTSGNPDANSASNSNQETDSTADDLPAKTSKPSTKYLRPASMPQSRLLPINLRNRPVCDGKIECFGCGMVAGINHVSHNRGNSGCPLPNCKAFLGSGMDLQAEVGHHATNLGQTTGGTTSCLGPSSKHYSRFSPINRVRNYGGDGKIECFRCGMVAGINHVSHSCGNTGCSLPKSKADFENGSSHQAPSSQQCSTQNQASAKCFDVNEDQIYSRPSNVYNYPSIDLQMDRSTVRESSRLASFINFPADALVNPILLAQLGFYYTGYEKETICFSCKCSKNDWGCIDDPKDVSFHSAACKMVLGTDTSNQPIENYVTLTDGTIPRTNRKDAQSPSRLENSRNENGNDFSTAGNELSVVLIEENACRETYRLKTYIALANGNAGRFNLVSAARHGWFYVANEIECFSCGAREENWRCIDDPSDAHLHNKECQLVLGTDTRNQPVETGRIVFSNSNTVEETDAQITEITCESRSFEDIVIEILDEHDFHNPAQTDQSIANPLKQIPSISDSTGMEKAAGKLKMLESANDTSSERYFQSSPTFYDVSDCNHQPTETSYVPAEVDN